MPRTPCTVSPPERGYSPCAYACPRPQLKKSKDLKQQPTALASAAVAASKSAGKPELPQREDKPPDDRGWRGSDNVQERQGMLVDELQAAAPKIVAANGVHAAMVVVPAQGKGRSRGTERAEATGKADSARLARSDVASAKFVGKGTREDEEELPGEVCSPVVAHESAERKDAQSPEYPSSMRKSPRSKEVRLRWW